MNNTHGNAQNTTHTNPERRFDSGQAPVEDDLTGLRDDVGSDGEAENDAATRSTVIHQEDLVELEDESPVDPGVRQAGTDVEGTGGIVNDRDDEVGYPPPKDDVL